MKDCAKRYIVLLSSSYDPASRISSIFSFISQKRRYFLMEIDCTEQGNENEAAIEDRRNVERIIQSGC